MADRKMCWIKKLQNDENQWPKWKTGSAPELGSSNQGYLYPKSNLLSVSQTSIVDGSSRKAHIQTSRWSHHQTPTHKIEVYCAHKFKFAFGSTQMMKWKHRYNREHKPQKNSFRHPFWISSDQKYLSAHFWLKPTFVNSSYSTKMLLSLQYIYCFFMLQNNQMNNECHIFLKQHSP